MVSVDRDVCTDKVFEGPDCANIWGKLSKRGNGMDVLDLQMPSMVSTTKNKEPRKLNAVCDVGQVNTSSTDIGSIMTVEPIK